MRLDKDRVAAVVNTQFGREMLAEGDRAQAGNPEKEQVWNLLLDEIEPDPEQPIRRHPHARSENRAFNVRTAFRDQPP